MRSTAASATAHPGRAEAQVRRKGMVHSSSRMRAGPPTRSATNATRAVAPASVSRSRPGCTWSAGWSSGTPAAVWVKRCGTASSASTTTTLRVRAARPCSAATTRAPVAHRELVVPDSTTAAASVCASAACSLA